MSISVRSGPTPLFGSKAAVANSSQVFGHESVGLQLVQNPHNAAALRALAKFAKLEVVKTETFPIERIDLFVKTL